MIFSIDRKNRKNFVKNLEKAKNKLRSNQSIVMFPEGTRSADGIIKPFKSGAFIMAIQMKMPILPIIIEGFSSF